MWSINVRGVPSGALLLVGRLLAPSGVNNSFPKILCDRGRPWIFHHLKRYFTLQGNFCVNPFVITWFRCFRRRNSTRWYSQVSRFFVHTLNHRWIIKTVHTTISFRAYNFWDLGMTLLVKLGPDWRHLLTQTPNEYWCPVGKMVGYSHQSYIYHHPSICDAISKIRVFFRLMCLFTRGFSGGIESCYAIESVNNTN